MEGGSIGGLTTPPKWAIRKDTEMKSRANKGRHISMIVLMGVVLLTIVFGMGCVSQLTVESGGQTWAGHCNHRERTWGSLYGIDWCGKAMGVSSQEPLLPMARVSAIVSPKDYFIGILTLGLIIPITVEYDMEMESLPKKGVR